jgi:hypothetical protein
MYWPLIYRKIAGRTLPQEEWKDLFKGVTIIKNGLPESGLNISSQFITPR